MPTDQAPQQQRPPPVSATNTFSAGKLWLLAAILVVVTAVAYMPAMRAGFIWDDDRYVTNNPGVQSLENLQKVWFKPGLTVQYYPLVFTSFWAEYQLWGLQPFGYHVVNILLHALNAVLLWFVLRKLQVRGSWWAASIFALHPVCVESVAWVTERKNVLSTLFYLLAVLAYFRFRPLTIDGAGRARDHRFYPLVVLLFLCALLCKTVTCSLPAALLLLVWWKTGRVEKRDVMALVPLFVLGMALGFVTAWMEKHRVGASGEEWALSFVGRCLVAGRAVWFYAGKLMLPRNLTFIYPRWEIDDRAIWQYLFPLAALAVLIALWQLRSRIGRGPLVAVLFFAGTLVPALGFFDVFPFCYSFVADHFQYLACVGLITLTTSLGATICSQADRQGRCVGAVTAVGVLVLLATLTWRQARVYHDPETLWQDTLAKNPKCWMAAGNLADELMRQGRLQEAIEHYEQALRIRPNSAEGCLNLGNALLQTGKLPEAIGEYEQALRIKPDFAGAHNNLGLALLGQGRLQEAINQYEQALRINPGFPEAHSNLGNALLRTGKLREAIEQCEQAVRLKPDLAEGHYNLGVALEELGRTREAIQHYEQALRIKPDFAEAQNALTRARAVP